MGGSMSGDDDEARRREAERSLERLSREAEVFGSSTLGRAAGRMARHVRADDVEADDRIEVWGTRIGRALAVVFAALLLGVLAVTYL